MARRRRCFFVAIAVDYAERFQAISPPAITVSTTGPPRWYARWLQSGAHEDDVRVVAWREPALAVGAAEHVRRVHGARGQGLLGRHGQLRRGERADEREALAERAARVEVRRERDGRARVEERAGGRHRAVEEQRARRQQDAGDVARRERRGAAAPVASR